MTGEETPFSPDYATARARFRAGAEALGFRREAFPIGRAGPSGEDLTIDAACVGDEAPERVLVVSSGLHGVEGFFGSAVQVALLGGPLRGWSPRAGEALVLLHALDPYGFAWVRRFDEGNVDLNRNFLADGQPYAGSPPRYAEFDALLNPPHPPRRLDLFYGRALLAILRYGFPAVKAAVAGGQYDFPRGLFFGGHGPSRVHQILAAQLPRWVGPARSVLHLDFHTGLGRWGTYKLLVGPETDAGRAGWVRRHFGAGRLESSDPDGIAYPTFGDIGMWCRSVFAGRDYDTLCAEFGTYPPLRVLAALRAENQAHHWLAAGHPASVRAKSRLKEVFVPDDPGWRSSVVAQALELLGRAFAAAFPR